MTFDIDTIESGGQSVTATVCENAALFGAAPERDEFDSRDVWDRDDATRRGAARPSASWPRASAPDGFQLADERESLLWGFVNMPRQPRPSASTAPPTGCCPRSATSSAPRTAPRSSRASWS